MIHLNEIGVLPRNVGLIKLILIFFCFINIHPRELTVDYVDESVF